MRVCLCLLCHRRESNSPRPQLPGKSGHVPCTGCHAQQFSNSDSPICTICHTDVKSGALKPFPRLKSFSMKFDHARHMKMQDVNCATCHRLLAWRRSVVDSRRLQRSRNLLSLSYPARTIAGPRHFIVQHVPSIRQLQAHS